MTRQPMHVHVSLGALVAELADTIRDNYWPTRRARIAAHICAIGLSRWANRKVIPA